jgi:hypothetical protein
VSRQIELHVKELVLDGFDGAEARGVGAALESELVRLLSSGSYVPTANSVLELDAGAFELGREPVASGIGRRVAGTVARMFHP